jgi:hypothetical protein
MQEDRGKMTPPLLSLFKTSSRLLVYERSCNSQPCEGDEICHAAMNLVFVVDGSGSVTERGFAILWNYAQTFINWFSKNGYLNYAVKVGVVQ